ncbi:MAG: DMT family transporter [Chelatococcus sp.]|nr:MULTISPECIES: DMT family transporter [unclassified Chelatococcus]CAH1652687.1 Threonine/homoserine efflux transporter RhtA [Hyphomicrobiales bacterium]MBS7742999.1 DMT family transporter [Chelatococcus sp. HY11]MBX3541883.1 DMT family transporter [Chelatococcus sp.]MCO5074226.1 DMT family transporter [Chelatococcus sp.]CAH1693994.1 Threonine/homoserine efflux transporter RhtA [Hyphomicrobiales bacterium]
MQSALHPQRSVAPPRQSEPLGITLLMAAEACFAVSGGVSKYLTGALPPLQIAWIRFAVFAAVVMGVIVSRRDWSALRSQCLGPQIVRCLGIVGATVFFILALKRLPLAETSALFFVSPLLIVLAARVVLGEAMNATRYIAVGSGFAGALLVIKPGSHGLGLDAILPLLAAVSWAVAIIATRWTGSRERPLTGVLYAALVGLAVTTAFLPTAWVPPDTPQLMFGIATGLAAAAGQWFIVLAYQRASASSLAPLNYVQLIWSALVGYVFFASVPDNWAIVGAVVIVLSGFFAIRKGRSLTFGEGRDNEHVAIRAKPHHPPAGN